MNLSISNQLYQCTCRPFCCSAWCYHTSFNYLFKLGKVVCSKPNELCKWQREIKNYQKKIELYTSN